MIIKIKNAHVQNNVNTTAGLPDHFTETTATALPCSQISLQIKRDSSAIQVYEEKYFKAFATGFANKFARHSMHYVLNIFIKVLFLAK